MAIDPAQLAATLSELIANLPLILQVTQILIYIFLILFLGSIAIIGCRLFLPFWKKILLRIALGFLCLISGISLAGFMPIFNEGIFILLQTSMIVAGILSSVVFAVSLYLISLRIPRSEMIKAEMERLEKKLNKARKKKPIKRRFLDISLVAGTLIIAVFLIFVVINFQGFPSFSQDIYSFFGFSPEDMENIGGVLGGLGGAQNMSAGCTDIMNFIAQNPDMLSDLSIWETHTNDNLKAEMENETGTDIAVMQRAEQDGKVIILGIVDTSNFCIATEDEVCYCMKS
jgi:hypothetical protein